MQNTPPGTNPTEPLEPFPGGELTVDRAAKLLGTTPAETKAMVADGRLESRSAPKPGGGEHTLVSLASVQAARADTTPPPVPPCSGTAAPEGELFDLSRRPSHTLPPSPAAAPAETAAVLDETPPEASSLPASDEVIVALNRLVERHDELLCKLDELIAVLNRRAEEA